MDRSAGDKAPKPTSPTALAALGTKAMPAPGRKAGRVIIKVRAGVDQGLSGAAASASGAITPGQAAASSAAAGALLGRHGARSAAPLFAARQRLKRGGMTEAQINARVRQRFAARAARASRNATLPDLGGYYVLDLGDKTADELQAAVAALRSDPDVISAQEDKVVKVSFTPNDPMYSQLWGMTAIRAGTAWDTAKGAGVTVAVVDSGIDYNHPDIVDNMWSNPLEIPGNGIDDDNNGLIDDVRGWDYIGKTNTNPVADNDPMDVLGHGTHVAGIVAAEGNNGLGVIGVAWQAKVMNVRALDDGGIGLESTLAPAIIYAADEGADVINASWGGPGQSDVIEAAIDHAAGLGAVFVAAAGNDGVDVSTFFPANAQKAIAVDAINNLNQLPLTNTGNKLDLAAPGVDILSLAPGGGYISRDGTSMAAPHVSGVAALILGLHPTFTPEQVRQVLRTSAIDLPPTGPDTAYGYGRVDATNAVAVNQVLEAKFFSPHDASPVHGTTSLLGTAQGPGFDHYVVEIGVGQFPSSYTQLVSSTTPVSGGSLLDWDPSALTDNIYTLRLRVFGTGGAVYQDRVQLQVRYALITYPAYNALPAFTDVVKAGNIISIKGRATGGSFQSFNLQWAPGRDATSGFSSAGITLAGGGTTAVDDGLLGNWATPTTTGEYTVKLTVNDAGFSSTMSSNIYLESDLVAGNWPQFASPGGAYQAPRPAKMSDGTTRLITCAHPSFTAGSSCRSTAADGQNFTGVNLTWGNYFGPAVGQLDTLPGDEVVIADDKKIKIFGPTLTPISEITTPRTESFTPFRVSLADLDGDGVMEIIAIARDAQPDVPGFFFYSGNVQVYKANGQMFSTFYPRGLTSPRMPNGIDDIDTLAVDLDGDGKKEILVFITDRDHTVYDVIGLRADGTNFPGWPSTVTFPVNGTMAPPKVADLDHDGHPEIVITEPAPSGAQIRVLNSDGTTRPGWPVAGFAGAVAIGDLDRDGRDEIVASNGTTVTALEPDGSPMPVTFPSLMNADSTTIADVDNDGFPDILVSTGKMQGVTGAVWFDHRLTAVSHTGSVIKEWRLFGINGRQTTLSIPAVGDFTGDGKTDIAVKVILVEGGGINGVAQNDELTMLTTGTPFTPATTEWSEPDHDAQQSRSKVPPAPATATLAPVADAHVRDGTNAGANFGTLTTLDCKNSTTAGNNRRTFLRFSLGGVGSSITSAKLRVSGASVTSAKAVGVYAISDNSWSETAVTWNNAPAIGAKQGASVTVGTTAQYWEWDVTSWVQAQRMAGAVSFELKQDAATGEGPTSFSSREATSNQPQLVVVGGVVMTDQPPTVASGPSASPNPAIGTTTALSVLGNDDHGEAALTYTWSATGSPPAPVTFSANGTNAAKNSTATFTAAGTYNLQVVIKDAANQTATAPLTVTVSQTLTTIAVTPATASVATGGTQQFTATAKDQFGAALTSQPTITWTVSGGGTISTGGLFTAGATAGGPFTVTAASGGKSGTAQVTVTGGGGSVTLNPVADAHVRDGTSAATNFGTVTPMEVKNTTSAGSVRRLFVRFAIDGVGSGVTQAKLRLNGNAVTTAKLIGVYAVANTTWGETTINWNNAPAIGAKQGASVNVGTTAQYWEWDVTGYIQSQKSAMATAVTFELKPDGTSNDGPSVFSSREAASNKPQLVVTTGGATNQPPTVATAAAASPNPATATTTALSVLGADDGSESALVYTWSTTGTPPAPVTFSANGTNAAKNTTATFTKAGSYSFQAVIKDAGNLTVTSSVSMTVSQTLTSVVVSPTTASVATGGTQQFTATARDQFANALTTQPSFTWMTSGGGTVSGTGLFTAGSTAGGPFTITATSGGKSATAQVTVTSGSTNTTLNPAADAHVHDGTSVDTNFGTAVTLESKNSSASGNNRRTLLRFSLTGVGNTVTQAKLRLFGASVTAAKPVGVYAIANTTWGETTITWNNAPAIGAKQGASQSVGTTAAYVEWDVTTYVNAQRAAGAVSFEVKQDAANNDSPTTFNARENTANKPQLVVTSN
jgi:subtilisin family serine protease